MQEKEVVFCGSSSEDLQSFPQKVKEKFVQDLILLSYGKKPLSTVSPLKGLGKGILELKKNGKPAYRCVYVIENQIVWVLHAFSKTSNGLDSKHENTIKSRFANR